MNHFIYILFLHWVADFVLQSDWMARNKNNNVWALTSHTIIYYLTIFFGLMFFWPIWSVFLFTIINALLHFCVDFFSSKITTHYFGKHDFHNGFVTVGADQLIHNICLYMTFILFLV